MYIYIYIHRYICIHRLLLYLLIVYNSNQPWTTTFFFSATRTNALGPHAVLFGRPVMYWGGDPGCALMIIMMMILIMITIIRIRLLLLLIIITIIHTIMILLIINYFHIRTSTHVTYWGGDPGYILPICLFCMGYIVSYDWIAGKPVFLTWFQFMSTYISAYSAWHNLNVLNVFQQ